MGYKTPLDETHCYWAILWLEHIKIEKSQIGSISDWEYRWLANAATIQSCFSMHGLIQELTRNALNDRRYVSFSSSTCHTVPSHTFLTVSLCKIAEQIKTK